MAKEIKKEEMKVWDGPVFGLVVKVTGMPPPDKNNPGDPIFIHGESQVNIHGVIKYGDPVRINVDPKNLESSRDNLNKGGDLDSVIVFDRCRIEKNEDGTPELDETGVPVISSGYLRTVFIGTGFGRRDPKTAKHASRMLIDGLMDAPTVSFNYNGKLGGKEGYLPYPISAAYKDFNFNVNGELQTVRITEDMVKESLKDAWDEAMGQGGIFQALKRVQVTANLYETGKALKVSNKAELQDAIASTLNGYNNNGTALVRVVDKETGEMLVRKVFGRGYGEDRENTAITAERFVDYNKIDVSAASVVEVIPGVIVRYMGTSDQTLIGKFAKEYLNLPGKTSNNTVEDIRKYGITSSGTDEGQFTAVTVLAEPANKIPGYFVPIANPLPMLRDTVYTGEQIQTENIAIAVTPADLKPKALSYYPPASQLDKSDQPMVAAKKSNGAPNFSGKPTVAEKAPEPAAQAPVETKEPTPAAEEEAQPARKKFSF